MSPHHNNLINAFLVNVGVRPGCLLQIIDYKNQNDAQVTLDKIKELFPELYLSPNYQGILITKTPVDHEIDTCEKLGEILGYPYKDEFTKMINENTSGYVMELTCYYIVDDCIHKTQLIANICMELDKLNEFQQISDHANKYTHYKIENIELYYFSVEYEKNYNTSEVLNYVYHNKKMNPDIIYHIGNIIWNMEIIENNDIIYAYFQYNKRIHRYIVCGFLMMDLFMDKYHLRLPPFTLKPIRWLLKTSLYLF